jgi:UPF0755 protein
LVFALVGAIVVLGLVGGGLFLYGRSQLEPVSADHGKAVTVTIATGESVDAVAGDLANHGLIKSQFWFSQFARLKGLGDRLRAGQFSLDPGMGASAIISKLEAAPDVAPRRVSLAEGLTLDQMATKVGGAGLGISRDQYLNAVAHDTFNAPFLSMRPAGNTSLEGFLFPDTYDVPEGATAHNVVQMQLDTFARKAVPLLPTSGAYDRVIVASIIEREAKFTDDQPLVASVIDNRLSTGMHLQIDAIVVYGVHKVGEAMSPQDQRTDTPYNSYLHAGLPPTPIANPGVATLQAAVHPGSTNYLFYVSDSSGHNHYATTAAEHCQNVRKYLGQTC